MQLYPRQWLLANVLLSLNANLGAFAVYGHRRHTTQTVVGAGVAPRRFFLSVAWQNDFGSFFRQARKKIRSRSTLYVKYFLTAHDGERAGIGQTCPHERRRDDINVVLRVPIWERPRLRGRPHSALRGWGGELRCERSKHSSHVVSPTGKCPPSAGRAASGD